MVSPPSAEDANPPLPALRQSLGLYVGVSVKLGAKGIEQIIRIKLTPEGHAALNKSADAVKELVGVIGV
jgi:malate/lactate dehydrogenase